MVELIEMWYLLSRLCTEKPFSLIILYSTLLLI